MSEAQEPKPHVLLVDDERSILSALRRTLRKEGYELTIASSGQEALDKLREMATPPDLVISDHLMPGMTGLEFLKHCRLRYPDLGRIVLTGQAELETVVSAINQGEVFRFLRKPWDDNEIKLAIHLAIRHVRLESENRRLLSLLKEQAQYLKKLEKAHPGIIDVRRDESGAILIDEAELEGL